MKPKLLIFFVFYAAYTCADSVQIAKKLGQGEAEMLQLNQDLKGKYVYSSFELIVSYGYPYQWNGCDITRTNSYKSEHTLWEAQESKDGVHVVSCEINLGFYKFCSGSPENHRNIYFSIKHPDAYMKDGWHVRAWVYPSQTPKIAQSIKINCVN